MDSGDGSFVGTHGALRAVGNSIHDRNDQPIQLRGMSLYWSQWHPKFYDAETIRRLVVDWQSSLVRAAMAVEYEGYLDHPEDERARVETVVDAAIANDLYVLIDWHDHHADLHADQAQIFFAAMAQKYANVPNVMFEIWNEPIDVSWPEVKSYAERTLGTIRGKGANNLVIVGSPSWSTEVVAAADDRLADPNVAYTFHFYAASHKQESRDKIQLALDKGIAIFATEWGTCTYDGNGFIDEESSTTWLDFLAERNISWANWSMSLKEESCTALNAGATPTGPWAAEDLSQSGAFVKNRIGPRP